MKKILKNLFILWGVVIPLSSFTLNSCTFMGDSVKPSKTFVTRNYEVGNFTGIEFSGMCDVEYTQSAAKPSLKIYGPDNYVKATEVKVEGNMLKISIYGKYKNKNLSNSDKMKISISTPSLTNVILKGLGNINIPQPIQIDNLEIIHKGVGNITVSSVKGNSLTVNSSGVGNVKLAGNVHVASLSCNGVGNVNAKELQAKIVDANCRGVGNITCYAMDSITASAKGVGSIRYRGNPKQKDLNRSGIGSIRNVDN